ncbi:MAG: sensor histidine kinase, partial [Cellulosimicrobium funkei]
MSAAGDRRRAGERRAPTLRRRLGWALVVAGVILLGVLATSAIALSRVLTLQTDVTGPFFDAVSEADGAYVGLLDAEVAVRAYVATGDATALEAYTRAVGVDAEGVVPDAALVDRLGLDDELAGTLTQAESSVRAWVSDAAEPAIATTEAQGPGRVRAVD